ncbi:putative membrane protein YdbT with pleckstrin-like domain [Natronocella acetinitrilica]|uniref:Membrane protein YdbT with pleckstrin-like domain n=1 Tax=Natronocella acetinitrilica TaxID=414046 RepID=A0AAE3KBD8_9GAMM|nr:PH domain-containing protein [Natronocella acetinitrilica]MCP1674556.1 putative membrane protein YdbT with pleckstrin-like domain [Natronocella acetinitrilica]
MAARQERAQAGRRGERFIWQATPSQWINLMHYLVVLPIFTLAITMGTRVLDVLLDPQGVAYYALITAAATAPVFLAIWQYLVVAMTRYALTTERIQKRTGVLNIIHNQVELYRVKDYRVERPLLLRLVGLGTLSVETSDRNRPVVRFVAIRDPERLADALRRLVEHNRNRRGVREIDVS